MQTYFNKWECSYQKRAQVICLVCVGWIHCQWACCQFTITVLFPPWFYTYLLLATLAQNRIYPSIFRVFTDILTRFHSRMWSGTRQSVCIKESLIPKEVGLVRFRLTLSANSPATNNSPVRSTLPIRFPFWFYTTAAITSALPLYLRTHTYFFSGSRLSPPTSRKFVYVSRLPLHETGK